MLARNSISTTRRWQRAKQVLLVSTGLSARNALHVAIMERYEIHQLLSFDAGFDRVLWIERLRAP